jgi:threonine aldolase
MLVGNRKFIERARSIRKMLGGGMRQAGVLAASGLIALEEMPKRLHQDHANARLLAECMAQVKKVEIDLATVQTNIVIFKVRGYPDVAPLVAAMKKSRLLAGTGAVNEIRFVTHNDVDRSACEQAARIAAEAITAA